MRSLLSDPRLEAIAGRPAAVATELGTWVTPEPDARLSGISLYVVYSSDGDTTRNYSGFVRYGAGGGSADGQLYIQTSSAGNDVVQVRADTNNGSANVGLASSGGRLAGIHTHSTVVEDGCTGVSASLDGGPPVSKPLTAGGGIPRERLIIDNGAGPQQIPLIAIAYNRAHNLPTRRRIEAYLKSIMRQQVTLGFHQAASAPQDKPIVESLPDGTTRITTTSTGTAIIYWQPIPFDLTVGSRVSIRANVAHTNVAEGFSLRNIQWGYLTGTTAGTPTSTQLAVKTAAGAGVAYPTLRISGKPAGSVVTVGPLLAEVAHPSTVTDSAPIFTRTGTGSTVFAASQTPKDPVTVYACWPGGLKASERFSIASPAWLAAGRSGDGRAFAMRQSTTGATVIAYADRVVAEGAPIVLSATADGSRISVQTLGDGPPRSAWINCGPAQTDALNITSSGSAGAPTVQIYSGVHSDAKRDKIMRLMADRYGVAI